MSGAYTDRSGPAYQAAKAGSIALTHGAGFEAGGEIRCTVILPGVVDTPILDNRPEPPDAEMRAQMLHPEDIAAAWGSRQAPAAAYVPELTILPTAFRRSEETRREPAIDDVAAEGHHGAEQDSRVVAQIQPYRGGGRGRSRRRRERGRRGRAEDLTPSSASAVRLRTEATSSARKLVASARATMRKVFRVVQMPLRMYNVPV